MLLQSFNQARGSGYEVYKTIDEYEKLKNKINKGKKINKINGKIEYKNIKFHYPSRPKQNILNNFNCIINSGETIGIVGKSGCGKSTILQLLQKFYNINEGELLIDDKNIIDYNTKDFRKKIGIVNQEPILYSGTIKDNIRYGNLECNDEDIYKASRDANAHEFIIKLKDGYNTFVGEDGNLLSGGQKQRIAIARALIRNPSIMILDEATSGLDSENEKIVQESLDKIIKLRKCTTLIVAHRLSTIENVDRIIVIDNGKIVEEGTNNELMKLNGIYANLKKQQQNHIIENIISPKSDDEENIQINNDNRDSRYSNEIITNKKNEKIIDIKENKRNKKIIMKNTIKNKCTWILAIISSLINGCTLPIYSLFFAQQVEILYYDDLEKQKKVH